MGVNPDAILLALAVIGWAGMFAVILAARAYQRQTRLGRMVDRQLQRMREAGW